eukprot:TRINITY_DN1401_c0_g1_i1.p1 TRINITY_DN1401_c0_g1~~TRINITY_DN1401_c0_g1_i1.p1  ORF type:complete len:773 (+),score=219.24 TRINITY_DN1401_c0_g1_i1:36-2321(+)
MPVILDVPINEEPDTEDDGEVLSITVPPNIQRKNQKRKNVLVIIGWIFVILVLLIIIRVLRTTEKEHYPLYPSAPVDEVGPIDGHVDLGDCLWLNLTLVPNMYAKNHLKYEPKYECLLTVINVDGNDFNSLKALISTLSYNLPGVENTIVFFTGFNHELIDKIYKIYGYTAVKLPLPVNNNNDFHDDLYLKSKSSSYETMLLLKEMDIHHRFPIFIVDNEHFVSSDFYVFSKNLISSFENGPSSDSPLLLGFKGETKLPFNFQTFTFDKSYDLQVVQEQMSSLKYFDLWSNQPFVITPSVYDLFMESSIVNEFFSIPASFHDSLLFLQTRGYIHSSYIAPVYTRICELDVVKYSIVPQDVLNRFPVFPNPKQHNLTLSSTKVYDLAFEHFEHLVLNRVDVTNICIFYGFDEKECDYDHIISNAPDDKFSSIEWMETFDFQDVELINCRVFNYLTAKQHKSKNHTEYFTVVRFFNTDDKTFLESFENMMDQIEKVNIDENFFTPVWIQYVGQDETTIYDVVRHFIKPTMSIIVTVDVNFEINLDSFEKFTFLKSVLQPIIMSKKVVPILFLDSDCSLSSDYDLAIQQFLKFNIYIDSQVYPSFSSLDGKELAGQDDNLIKLVGGFDVKELVHFKNIFLDEILIKYLRDPRESAKILQILNFGENLEESLRIFVDQTFVVNVVKSLEYSRIDGNYLPQEYQIVNYQFSKNDTNLQCINSVIPQQLNDTLKKEMKQVADQLKVYIPEFPSVPSPSGSLCFQEQK